MSLDVRPEVESLIAERAAEAGISVDDLLSRAFGRSNGMSAPDEDTRLRLNCLLEEWRAQDTTPFALQRPRREEKQ